MPLRKIFHLDTARPSTVTVLVDPATDELMKVIKITGSGSIAVELQKHAREAKLMPDPIANSGIKPSNASRELEWSLLAAYDGFSEELRLSIDEAFIPIFDNLDVEYEPTPSIRGIKGDLRIFMRKPDGTHTETWVFKDNVRNVETHT